MAVRISKIIENVERRRKASIDTEEAVVERQEG